MEISNEIFTNIEKVVEENLEKILKDISEKYGIELEELENKYIDKKVKDKKTSKKIDNVKKTD